MRTEPICSRWGTIVLAEGKTPDSINRDEVLQLYKTRGVVLFRGFEFNTYAFQALTEQFTSDFRLHGNSTREIISSDETVATVSGGQEHFFAHSEHAFSPLRPDTAWFYCVTPAKSGGETTIYDGVEVLERLSEETRVLFNKKRIRFRTDGPEFCSRSELNRWVNTDGFSFECDQDGRLHTTFVTSAIVKTKYTNSLAFANSMLDQQQLYFEDGTLVPRAAVIDVLGTTERLAFPLSWQKNDVLMIDNTSFMHGRRSFRDRGRRILARFGMERQCSANGTPNHSEICVV